MIIESERGTGLKCFASLDNDEFYELKGDIKKGITTLKFNNKNEDLASPPRCRKLKLSFRDNTQSLCKMSKVAIIYAVSMEEEEETRQL